MGTDLSRVGLVNGPSLVHHIHSGTRGPCFLPSRLPRDVERTHVPRWISASSWALTPGGPSPPLGPASTPQHFDPPPHPSSASPACPRLSQLAACKHPSFSYHKESASSVCHPVPPATVPCPPSCQGPKPHTPTGARKPPSASCFHLRVCSLSVSTRRSCSSLHVRGRGSHLLRLHLGFPSALGCQAALPEASSKCTAVTAACCSH